MSFLFTPWSNRKSPSSTETPPTSPSPSTAAALELTTTPIVGSTNGNNSESLPSEAAHDATAQQNKKPINSSSKKLPSSSAAAAANVTTTTTGKQQRHQQQHQLKRLITVQQKRQQQSHNNNYMRHLSNYDSNSNGNHARDKSNLHASKVAGALGKDSAAADSALNAPTSTTSPSTLAHANNSNSNTNNTPTSSSHHNNNNNTRLFILENTTSHPIYFATKSLHLHFVRFPLHDHTLHSLSNTFKSPPRRHILSGPNAWNNLVRYELAPKDYVQAWVLNTNRTSLALLFVEFKKERPIVTQTAATPTAEDSPMRMAPNLMGSDSRSGAHDSDALFSSANQSNSSEDVSALKHSQSVDSLSSNSTFNSNIAEERIFRSYWIELDPNAPTDIILRVKVEKTLFSKKRFCVEPISSWFSSKYSVCADSSDAPPCSVLLSNNISKRQLVPVVKTSTPTNMRALDSNSNLLDSKDHYNRARIPMPSRTRIPKTSNSSPDSAMSVCEEETLDLLRENIVMQLSFLHRMKRKLRLLVIRDEKQRDFDPIHYLMQHVVRLNTELIRNWFQSCVELYEMQPQALHEEYMILPMSFSRCLNVYHRKSWEHSSIHSQIDPVYSHISGIIVLPSVTNGLPSTLTPILQKLEGFPLLFMLHGLLECSTIYDALQKKELVEMDIVRIFSSTHKPLIVSCIEKKTETENITTCIFLRESIDSQVEKLIADAPTDETMYHLEKIDQLVSGLLSNDNNSTDGAEQHEQENSATTSGSATAVSSSMPSATSSATGTSVTFREDTMGDDFLRRNPSAANFFFYSVDNEQGSVEAALDLMPSTLLSAHEIFVYAASREQFNNNAKLLLSGGGGKRLAENSLSSTIRRNMSTLWSQLGQSSDDEFCAEEEFLESRIRKVKSSSHLSSLERSALSPSVHYRTGSEEHISQEYSPATAVTSPPLHSGDKLLGRTRHRANSSLITPASAAVPDAGVFLMDQLGDNSFTQTQKTLESSIMNESTLSALGSTTLTPHGNRDTLNAQENALHSSFSVTPTKTMLSVSGTDIVVLCVELSGRVLIHGKNGIFSQFLHEARQCTKNIVLFVDRRDRNTSIEDSLSPSQSLKYEICEADDELLCGDAADLELDKELQNTQNIQEFCRFRCYCSSANHRSEILRLFWTKVVEKL